MVALTIWTLLVGLAAAGCELEAPADRPFAVAAPQDASHVRLLVEVWAEPGEEAWAEAMLGVLTQRELSGVLVVHPDHLEGELGAVAQRAVEAEHEVALHVDRYLESGELRERLKTARGVVGEKIETVATVLPSRVFEAAVEHAGVRVILEERADRSDQPRVAARYEGYAGLAIVLPHGRYRVECQQAPHLTPWTPRTADLVTEALTAAKGGRTLTVVRIALHQEESATDQARTLGQWIDVVILPASLAIQPPQVIYEDALAAWRGEGEDQLAATKQGRLVSIADVLAAAEGLREIHEIPPVLPGDLNPTEAWIAFEAVLAGKTEGDFVRLGEMKGPQTGSSSTLTEAISLPASSVQALIVALAAAPPESLPSSLPVGGHLLTTGEFLVALAGVVRGEDLVLIQPISVPQPTESVQGWGVSKMSDPDGG